MRRSDCKVGGLYRVTPSPGMPNRSVLVSAKSGGHELVGVCSVSPDEIILLIAIQEDYDEHSAYEMIGLLGDRFLFVRPGWIKKV